MTEKTVAFKLLTNLIENGFTINLNNGGDGLELKEYTNDIPTIMRELFATGEDLLICRKEGKYVGTIFLVSGNEPEELISDYSCSLEEFIPQF